MMDHPILVFSTSLAVLWLSCYTGIRIARKSGKLDEDQRSDLNVILTGALTLLSLIIGFSFSMAVTRYDQRKNLEAEEANAIGTEMARAGLMPAPEAARLRELLRAYLKQRILFHLTRDTREIQQINIATAQLQANLWSSVQEFASRQPTPIAALAVSGMNDVLNSQGYAQASWWNRIPIAAWVLMAAIAVGCHGLLGYTERRLEGTIRKLLIFPLIVSTAFFLIADIDSPRGGVTRVYPHNLENVSWPPHAP